MPGIALYCNLLHVFISFLLPYFWNSGQNIFILYKFSRNLIHSRVNSVPKLDEEEVDGDFAN